MHSTLLAADGREIKLFAWLPPQPVRQVLVISHGMAEHIERYTAFVSVCNDAGIAVYGANHRGHGDDADIQGHYSDQDGWHKVVSDLDMVIDEVISRHQLPPVLLGHSMGSFIARQYAILHGHKLAGLILSGSNYQSPLLYQGAYLLSRFEKWRIGAQTPSKLLDRISFGAFNRNFTPVRTDFDWLSSDAQQVDKYISDDNCGFLCSAQFWCDFMAGLINISKGEQLALLPSQLPIYIFSGDKDPVGANGKGVIALERELVSHGCQQVSLHLYPQGRHEMFNEINAEQVYADVVNWLIATVVRPLQQRA